MQKQIRLFGWALGSLLVLSCGFWVFSCGTNSSKNPVAQQEIPGIVFVSRGVDSLGDPLDPIEFTPSGNLFTLVPGTPSGTLRNLTADLTNGSGDASDPLC